METWKDRLKNEYEELNSRLKKLDSFIETSEKLDRWPYITPYSLFMEQKEAMTMYRDILAKRLEIEHIV